MSLGQEAQLAPALSMTNEKCEMIFGKCSDLLVIPGGTDLAVLRAFMLMC